MKVSVIIPTKNRVPILEETLTALTGLQSYSKNEVEVIVVNDGHKLPDGIAAKYPHIRFVNNKGAGAANARNMGAAVTTGDLIIFLDDDILVSRDCIDRHVAQHEKYLYTLVSGIWEYSPAMKERSANTPFGRYKIKYDYQPMRGDIENPAEAGVYFSSSLATFNLSIARNDFLTIGGFNTDFPFAGCEDQEFTMRAAQKGLQLLVDTTIVCQHNEHDRLSLNHWLMRQYTGIGGYVLLCDLFPFRKKDRLFVENAPAIRSNSINIRMKKMAKFLLSRSWALAAIKSLVRICEKVRLKDQMLFKFYNLLCGLYLYKGFRRAYYKLHV